VLRSIKWGENAGRKGEKGGSMRGGNSAKELNGRGKSGSKTITAGERESNLGAKKEGEHSRRKKSTRGRFRQTGATSEVGNILAA